MAGNFLILITYIGYFYGTNGQCSDNLDSSAVFDPVFYLNNHPDLTESGITSETAARNHWCTSGVDEGRQATSSFHSVQYLLNYEDLSEIYEEDLRGATLHYINNGKGEGRQGYVEGGSHGRWTVRSVSPVDGDFIFISTSDRCAAAVDSLVYKGKEFINSYDHGRQLQMAITIPPYGECFNPTEAGGESDGKGMDTKSEIQSISSAGSTLQTTNYPAYWIRGDGVSRQPSGSGCPTGRPSYNTDDTHRYNMSKTVTVGCFDMDNCIQFDMDADLGISPEMPTNYNFAQLEGPTAYLMSEFSEALFLDTESGQTSPVELEPGQNNLEDLRPVIIQTPGGEYALGAYTVPWSDEPGTPGTRYAYFRYPGITRFDQSTWKWSVVLRANLEPGESFIKTSYVCVGFQQMVVDCMMNVVQAAS